MNRKSVVLLFAMFVAALPLTSFMGVGVSAPISVGTDITCTAVSELFSLSPRDGQTVDTTGYSTAGIGANTYRYSAASVATVDGGFVLPGIGTGSLAWSGITFTGDSGTGRWLAVDTRIADVTQFGATVDGTTDDSSAFIRAATTATTNGATLASSKSGEAVITSTLTLNCSCNLENVTLKVSGATVSPVVRVGNTSGTGASAQLRITSTLPKMRNTQKSVLGWVGFDTTVGVEIANLYESRITIPYVFGFGIGVDVGGYNAGVVYNTFELGTLDSNKVNLRLRPHANTGWVNENVFISGRFVHDTAEDDAATGVKHIELSNPTGGSINPPNNNLFLRPSLEGDEPQYHIDCQGSFNMWISPRLEVPTGVGRVRFYSAVANETNSNQIVGGYDFGIAYTFDGEASPFNGRSNSRTGNSIDVTGSALNIVNRFSGTISGPHIQGFPTSANAIAKDKDSTDWTYRLYSEGLALKATADDHPRVHATSNGLMYFGAGSIAPNTYFYGGDGVMNVKGWFLPDTNEEAILGSDSRHWLQTYSKEFRPGSSGAAIWTSGSGSPEGVVSAPVGSMYTRTDGGTDTTLYIKETGTTGNTGWDPK